MTIVHHDGNEPFNDIDNLLGSGTTQSKGYKLIFSEKYIHIYLYIIYILVYPYTDFIDSSICVLQTHLDISKYLVNVIYYCQVDCSCETPDTGLVISSAKKMTRNGDYSLRE